MSFERVSSETLWKGRLAEARREVWHHEDGEEVEREVLVHPGAVAIVAYDDEVVWLVRQPRESVGDPSLLEIPAGKRDEEGEGALDTGRRELAEEIGMAAETWEEAERFYTSPGFTNEECIVYAATGLRETDEAEPDPGERIEIIRWPLERLDEAIDECRDSKSLVGLMWLRSRLQGA